MAVTFLAIILLAALISVFWPGFWLTAAKIIAIFAVIVLASTFIYTMFMLIHKCLGPYFGG